MSSTLPALLMDHLRAAPPPTAEPAAPLGHSSSSSSGSGGADLRVPALWCIINLTVGQGGRAGGRGSPGFPI